MPFITDEQARGMAEMMRQRAAIDPLFAEDLRSITESMPYVVRPHEGTPPIRCECCGTLVMLVPEAHHQDMDSRKPAIWEAKTGRKHTLRRCEWTQEWRLMTGTREEAP